MFVTFDFGFGTTEKAQRNVVDEWNKNSFVFTSQHAKETIASIRSEFKGTHSGRKPNEVPLILIGQ